MTHLKKNIFEIIQLKEYNDLISELTNIKTNEKFLNETLKWASKDGDNTSVKILIDFGADPNFSIEPGFTILHFAINYAKEDVLIELINRGADYKNLEYDEFNFIQICLKMGFINVLNSLYLDHSENLTYVDEEGRNYLHWACHFGEVKSVKFIIELGIININERDDNGWTAIHHACNVAGQHFKEVLQILFDKKADPLLLTNSNKTSLDLAYESGKAQDLIDILTIQKMVQLLISVDNVIVDKISNRDINPFNQNRGSDGDCLDRQGCKVPPTQSQPNNKLIDTRVNQKKSVWRKILLNDDVELLQEYRDSGIWYDPENPRNFEECQNLSKKNLCEIFCDSYENGVGIYSYFYNEFRDCIFGAKFLDILQAISGINRFTSLSSDQCTLFGSLDSSIIFVAFISGRFKVVELLLKMRQFDVIPVCLMISLIVQHLRQTKEFPQQIVDNLTTIASKAEIIAVDVLNRVYFIDNSLGKDVTLRYLNTPLSPYGNLSLIDLADLANCSNFLSLPCCQLILDKRWYGNLRPLGTHMRWIVRFIPISIFFYNPYNKNQVCTKFKRSSRYNDVETFSNTLQKRTSKSDDLPYQFNTLPKKNDPIMSLTKAEVFYSVIKAPNTKFFYHSVAHFIFLAILSYIMIFDFYRKLRWEEVACYAFVFGYAVEEFIQCLLIVNQSHLLDYLKDKWNWLDMLAILSTFVGFLIKVTVMFFDSDAKDLYSQSMEANMYTARIFICIGLLLFYLRILFILTISESLGPKLRMIVDMLKKDFQPMLLLFLIFIMAFGILFQSLLYPNGWQYKANANLVSRNISDNKAGVIGLLLRRAIYSIFEADYSSPETSCFNENYCSHRIGRILYTNVFLIIYIVIVFIMLMNLLIALFSDTVSRINERAMEHWLAGRYKLVEEYKERSIMPPPFNLFERFWNLIMLVCCTQSLCKCSQTSLEKCKIESKSDTNAVLKFIIIQSFALKTCRYKLGNKENKDFLLDTKKNDLELKGMESTIMRLEAKVDRLVLALTSQKSGNNSSNNIDDALLLKGFRRQDYPSRRSNKLSDFGSFYVEGGDRSNRGSQRRSSRGPDLVVTAERHVSILDKDSNSG